MAKTATPRIEIRKWMPDPHGRTREGLHYIEPGRPIRPCGLCGARVVHLMLMPATDKRPPVWDRADWPPQEINDVQIGDGWSRRHICEREEEL